MKALSQLTTAELERRLVDLEYALSGLAQLGGGEIPAESVAERDALRAEINRRKQKPPAR
jgi:hypothetical protein